MFEHWECGFLRLHIVNYLKVQFKVFEWSKQNRGEKFLPKQEFLAFSLPENPWNWFKK